MPLLRSPEPGCHTAAPQSMNMESVLLVFVSILLCFTSTSAFLIVQNPKKLCLSMDKSTVILGKCDPKNSAQQWEWTSDMRLLHMKSSRCLWANMNGNLPPHARRVELSQCEVAPAWRCYGSGGTFGLDEAPMFLKKLGRHAIIRDDPRYSNWTKYNADSGGKNVRTSLCPEKDTSLVSTSMSSSTHKPLGEGSRTDSTLKSAAGTDLHKQSTNTATNDRSSKRSSKPLAHHHGTSSNRLATEVDDVILDRTKRATITQSVPGVSTAFTEQSPHDNGTLAALSSRRSSSASDVSADVLSASEAGRQTPVTGPQTPATGQQTSATGLQTPATGPKTPATGAQTPATGLKTPATGAQTPATGQQTPATGQQTRATGQQTRATGAQTLATGPQSLATGTGGWTKTLPAQRAPLASARGDVPASTAATAARLAASTISPEPGSRGETNPAVPSLDRSVTTEPEVAATGVGALSSPVDASDTTSNLAATQAQVINSSGSTSSSTTTTTNTSNSSNTPDTTTTIDTTTTDATDTTTTTNTTNTSNSSNTPDTNTTNTIDTTTTDTTDTTTTTNTTTETTTTNTTNTSNTIDTTTTDTTDTTTTTNTTDTTTDTTNTTDTNTDTTTTNTTDTNTDTTTTTTDTTDTTTTTTTTTDTTTTTTDPTTNTIDTTSTTHGNISAASIRTDDGATSNPASPASVDHLTDTEATATLRLPAESATTDGGPPPSEPQVTSETATAGNTTTHTHRKPRSTPLMTSPQARVTPLLSIHTPTTMIATPLTSTHPSSTRIDTALTMTHPLSTMIDSHAPYLNQLTFHQDSHAPYLNPLTFHQDSHAPYLNPLTFHQDSHAPYLNPLTFHQDSHAPYLNPLTFHQD
ncbi:mucin-2-like [Gadus chalcogrammus]|uniref:mucin-2-like n=1 Tax=Gadus chalcogrammus TaxID=1042646 RepID=UPI0024C4A4C3|nr:mucin-2-like [Gadus chalcogrammus]